LTGGEKVDRQERERKRIERGRAVIKGV